MLKVKDNLSDKLGDKIKLTGKKNSVFLSMQSGRRRCSRFTRLLRSSSITSNLSFTFVALVTDILVIWKFSSSLGIYFLSVDDLPFRIFLLIWVALLFHLVSLVTDKNSRFRSDTTAIFLIVEFYPFTQDRHQLKDLSQTIK